MTTRVRLVAVVMQLTVVADDGETWRPVQVPPIQVGADQGPEWSMDATLAEVQRQVTAQANGQVTD